MRGLRGVPGVLGGVQAVDGEVVGGVVAAASGGIVRPVGEDVLPALLEVVHGAFAQVGIVPHEVAGNAAVRGVDVVLVPRVGRDECREAHNVLGESSRLVRADDRDRSQRLHRGQGADDGILAGHDLDGVRVRQRDDRLQTVCGGYHTKIPDRPTSTKSIPKVAHRRRASIRALDGLRKPPSERQISKNRPDVQQERGVRKPKSTPESGIETPVEKPVAEAENRLKKRKEKKRRKVDIETTPMILIVAGARLPDLHERTMSLDSLALPNGGSC
mmetsp:Transcript_32171/g.77770  ORF Transcript_32171/g.77770 Transcript_32171/m.77770 type:complete len:273 (-) Transcript_32171:1151-1969(-)